MTVDPQVTQALEAVLQHIRNHDEIVVGTAAPTHVADEPTLFWDKTNDLFYINSGGSTWIKIGGAGISAHAMLDGSTHSDSVAQGVTRGSIVVVNSTPKYDELVIGTSAQLLQSDGTDLSYVAMSGDATIAAGGAVTVAGTHAGTAHHDQSHTLISHSTNPQFSDVFSFVTAVDSLTLVSDVIQLPAAPFGLIQITSQSGATDDLVDIEINGGGTTLVPGTTILLTNTSGDAITLKQGAVKLLLSLGVDVTLNNNGTDIICLQAITNGIWVELWRSPSLMPVASLTVAGKVELATPAETTTGTDALRAVTPDGLAGSSIFGKKGFQDQIDPAATSNTVATKKVLHHIPPSFNGMDLVYVHAEVDTAGTTGTLTIDVNKNGTTMLSTKLTVDSTETGSDTAAAAAVIDTGADDVATNDVITIDVDAVHTTAAKGLVVTLEFQLP